MFLGEEQLKIDVALLCSEMPIEWDDADTVRFKHCHVRDLRQMVGVNEQLKLRFELEAALTQVAGSQCVIPCHLLSEAGIDHHGLFRF